MNDIKIDYDFFHTNNEVIGKISRKLVDFQPNCTLSDSYKIMSILGYFSNIMIKTKSSQSEVTMDSIFKNNCLLYSKANFKFNIDLIGLTDLKIDSIEDIGDFVLNKNNYTDSDIGILSKLYMKELQKENINEEDLVRCMFTEIASYINQNKLVSEFTTKVPVGNTIVKIDFFFKYLEEQSQVRYLN